MSLLLENGTECFIACPASYPAQAKLEPLIMSNGKIDMKLSEFLVLASWAIGGGVFGFGTEKPLAETSDETAKKLLSELAFKVEQLRSAYDSSAQPAREHWAAKYWTPENLCANCRHPRNCHLDQPALKGGPADSDRGWCALPPGTCIFSPCDCKAFVEPQKADEVSRVGEAGLRLAQPVAGGLEPSEGFKVES